MIRLIPLDTDAVRRGLGAAAEDVTVRLSDTIDSTSTAARRAAESDRTAGRVPPVTLFCARAQTAGRGRLGRDFFSPSGTGLYMTLLVPTSLPLSDAVGVTAGAAVAAAKVVEDLTGLTPGIKWVNDLYLGGRKVAGILTEAVSPLTAGQPTCLLVGIGLNLTTQTFPDGLRAPAASLSDFAPDGTVIDAGLLCGRIAAELLGMIRIGSFRTPACLFDYRSRLLWKGQPIVCTRGGDRFDAVLRDVDEHYRLISETETGTVLLDSGEVSVKG